MKRVAMTLALLMVMVLIASPAGAKAIDLAAAPNPAVLGDRVRHTATVGTYGRLEVWVSAKGFDRPAMGTLPPGTWAYECCPSMTAGTPAWHYRSSATVGPGSYGFRAPTRLRGAFLSTAAVGASSAAVWVQVR